MQKTEKPDLIRSGFSFGGSVVLRLRGDLHGARVGFGCVLMQLVVEAVEGELEAIGNAQLVVDLAQIVFDDLLGGTELVGDFLIALALGDAGDDEHLLLVEAGLIARVIHVAGLGAIGFDNPGDGLIVDPGFAGGDFAHALNEQIGRDGTGNDAADTATVKVDGVRLIGGGGLDDDFEIGGEANDGGNRVGGAGDHGAFEKEDIGGNPLDGVLQALEVIGLSDHGDAGVGSEDLAHTDAIDGLRISEDDTNLRPGLYRLRSYATTVRVAVTVAVRHREVRLLEPVLVDYSGGEGLTIIPIRTDNSSRAVHRRSHRELQRARRNLHKKFNVRPFPKRFPQAEKNAAGGKIFGERFIVPAIGENGYPQLQGVTDGASAGWPVTGSGSGANSEFHRGVSIFINPYSTRKPWR